MKGEGESPGDVATGVNKSNWQLLETDSVTTYTIRPSSVSLSVHPSHVSGEWGSDLMMHVRTQTRVNEWRACDIQLEGYWGFEWDWKGDWLHKKKIVGAISISRGEKEVVFC